MVSVTLLPSSNATLAANCLCIPTVLLIDNGCAGCMNGRSLMTVRVRCLSGLDGSRSVFVQSHPLHGCSHSITAWCLTESPLRKVGTRPCHPFFVSSIGNCVSF